MRNSRTGSPTSSSSIVRCRKTTEQHWRVFPSYLTKDLSRAIASNLTAIKLLVTNIQADAEISGSTAVDIIERAVYYLKEKGKLPLPVPTLITHYIINDPKIAEPDEATT